MKKLLSIVAVVFCLTAIFGFSGCTQIEDAVTQIKNTINQVTEAIDMLEDVSDEVTKALEDAEAKAEELQSALDEAEEKLDEFDASIDAIQKENAQLRKEINCLKGIHSADHDITYEWSIAHTTCTATAKCVCNGEVTETVTATEVDGVITAVFTTFGFETQTYTPVE